MFSDVLTKMFGSVLEFHKWLKDKKDSQMKIFDEKIARYEMNLVDFDFLRNEMDNFLNNVNLQVHTQFTAKQELDKYYNDSLLIYGQTMQKKVKDKLSGCDFDLELNVLTNEDILKMDKEIKKHIVDNFKMNSKMSNTNYNLPVHFRNKLEQGLSNIKEQYEAIQVSVANYIGDWKQELSKEFYLDEPTLKNQNNIIIQRRDKLLNCKNREVRQLTLDLFELVFPAIVNQNNKIKNNMEKEYKTCFADSIKLYDKSMRQTIEKLWKMRSFDTDLSSYHIPKRDECCQYFLYETKKKLTNESLINQYVNRVNIELQKRKGIYDNVMQEIRQLRSSWVQHINTHRVLSSDRIEDFRQQLLRSMLKTGDNELDLLLQRQFQKTFEEFKQKNEEIESKEKDIGHQIVSHSFKLFCNAFDKKLRSDLFQPIQIDSMFAKLLDYTLKAVTRRGDFKECQRDLQQTCLDQLTTQLKTYLFTSRAKHSQNSVLAKSTIKMAVQEAIRAYEEEIKRRITSDNGLRKKEFQTFISSTKIQCLEKSLQLFASLREYFDDNYCDKVVKDCREKIETELNAIEKKYWEEFVKTAKKETSIAVYMGRHNIYGVNYDSQRQSVVRIDDINGQDFRPNCVAIDNEEVLLGTDASHYYQQKQKNKDFDIKSLLTKSCLSRTEKLSLPLEFREDMKVRVGSVGTDLCVESLVALQVADIVSDAEKQLQREVTNAVITVPTRYDIKHKNVFRDVAEIAGIESVEVLSEMTAAAIGFARDERRITKYLERDVVVIVMNDNECDAALCKISHKSVIYRYFIAENFNTDDIVGSRNSSNPLIDRYYTKIKKTFKVIFEKLSIDFDSSKQKTISIDDIVIAGSSPLIQDLINYINKSDKFHHDVLYECDPIDVIVYGSAIYSKIFENQLSMRIKEVSLLPISFRVKYNNQRTSYINNFIGANQTLGIDQTDILSPTPSDLPPDQSFPIEIFIHQNNKYVDKFQIKPFESEFYTQDLTNFNHNLVIGLTERGQVYVRSSVHSKSGKFNRSYTVKQLKLGLTPDQIQVYKNLVKHLLKRSQKTQNSREVALMTTREVKPTVHSMSQSVINPVIKSSVLPNAMSKSVMTDRPRLDSDLIEAKRQLWDYYNEIKRRVDTNTSLRPLRRETIEKQLTETSDILNRIDANCQQLRDQKIFIENMVKKFNI